MTDPKGADRMKRAEKEIGDNIPDGMIGLDTEDVGEPDRPTKGVPEASTDNAEDADKSA